MRAILFALLSLPAFSAIAFVQGEDKSNLSGTSAAETLTVTLTFSASSAITVSCASYPVPSAFAVSDGVNTYTYSGVEASAYSLNLRQYYALNVASGSTTVTCSQTGALYSWMTVREFSGVKTTSALIDSGCGTGNSSSPLAPSLTSGVQPFVIVNDIYQNTFPWTLTAGASFTLVPDGTDPTQRTKTQYRILSSTGSYTSPGTSNASAEWLSCSMFLEDASGSGGGSRRRITVIQ